MADAKTKPVSGNLHVGTMGWSYSFWKPNFYPKGLGSEDFLSYYSKHLDTVEVDSTFYRIPRSETVVEWKRQTPDVFLFSLKFPQKITHIKMLKDAQEETRAFLERISLLKEKLGVLLLQFPPMFRQEHFSLLKDYLAILPDGYRYAVEVRNKSLLNAELYALLREHNIALAWVDASKMPLAEEVTADFLYVRWEGDRKTVTGTLGKTEIDRSEQIKAWAEKLETLLEKATPVFGYFSKYYSGFPTWDASELLRYSRKAS